MNAGYPDWKLIVIIVVASSWDRSAAAFASRHTRHDIRVLTPPDLSATGWQLWTKKTGGGTAIVQQRLTPEKDITGVLTRLPSVTEQELPHVVAEDRSYVAAEMTAFLLFWLSQLKCPVMNRPTPSCLSGPFWRTENWIHVAAQVGIPVEPVHRQTGFFPSGSTDISSSSVTVVDRYVFGDTDRKLHRRAQRLADVSGVQMLVAHFSSPDADARLVSAGVYPDLSDDVIGNAVLESLQ